MRLIVISESGNGHCSPVIKKQANDTLFYDFSRFPQLPKAELSADHNMECSAVRMDCLEAAMQLKSQGFNPLVLNMASNKVPGGGYLSGAGAQEENVFRRSNYFQILPDRAEFKNNRNWDYPLSEFGAVYSPSVFVFRGSEAKGYPLLPEAISFSFIAIAAYRRPSLVYEKGTSFAKLNWRFAKGTKRKIKTILHIAQLHGHDSLVLSAFGCGAFKNPARHIAALFHEVIYNDKWAGVFKKIIFAIIEDKNSVSEINPDGNFRPFKDIFGEDPDMSVPPPPSDKDTPPPPSHAPVSKQKTPTPKNPTYTQAYETATHIYFSAPNEICGFLAPDFKFPFHVDITCDDNQTKPISFWSVSQYLAYRQFQDLDIKHQILACLNVKSLLTLTHAFADKVPEDWQEKKAEFLREANSLKFHNSELRGHLQATRPKQLVFLEDPTNELGKQLEALRDQIATEPM